MDNISKDIMFCILQMLPKNDITRLGFTSKKIYNHIKKFKYQYYLYIYDDYFPDTLDQGQIKHLKIHDDYNKKSISLIKFTQLTSLHLGCNFNQEFIYIINPFLKQNITPFPNLQNYIWDFGLTVTYHV